MAWPDAPSLQVSDLGQRLGRVEWLGAALLRRLLLRVRLVHVRPGILEPFRVSPHGLPQRFPARGRIALRFPSLREQPLSVLPHSIPQRGNPLLGLPPLASVASRRVRARVLPPGVAPRAATEAPGIWRPWIRPTVLPPSASTRPDTRPSVIQRPRIPPRVAAPAPIERPVRALRPAIQPSVHALPPARRPAIEQSVPLPAAVQRTEILRPPAARRAVIQRQGF